METINTSLESLVKWDETTIRDVWELNEGFAGLENIKRDPFGRFMHEEEYKNAESPFAWGIGLLIPESSGGTLELENLQALSLASLEFKGDLPLDEALQEWMDVIAVMAEDVISPMGEIEVSSILRECDYFLGNSLAYGELICAVPQGKRSNLNIDELKDYEFKPVSVRQAYDLLTKEKVRFYNLRLYM